MSKISTSEKEPHYRGSFFIESKQDMVEMFRQVGPRYDLLNHLFSLGRDINWRRKSVQALNFKPGDRILDFGAGTGDFGLEVRRQVEVDVIALDLSLEMLGIMRQKAGEHAEWLSLTIADGENIPFSDNSFAGAVAGFVGRNLFDLRQGLSEIRRVLQTGGRLGFLEFCRPESSIMRIVSWLYFRLFVLPLGGLIQHRMWPAYRYLIDTIEAFHSAAQMRYLLSDVGFRDVHTLRFNLGTVALTVGTK